VPEGIDLALFLNLCYMSNSKIDLQSKKKEFEELFTELDEGNMGNQRRFMDGDKRSQEVWQWIEYLLAEREKEIREEIRKQLQTKIVKVFKWGLFWLGILFFTSQVYTYNGLVNEIESKLLRFIVSLVMVLSWVLIWHEVLNEKE